MTAPSLIIRSGDCNRTWLCRLLVPLLFGGDYSLYFDSQTRDCWPMQIDWKGHPAGGGVS